MRHKVITKIAEAVIEPEKVVDGWKIKIQEQKYYKYQNLPTPKLKEQLPFVG